ncbi:MAG: alpha/beta hydrolase [Patescibacteria group bacterium]
MKNAIILHGTGDSPDKYWFPWLEKELKAWGFEVWLPALPNAEYPNLKEWLPYILENGEINGGTILIGHSAGAQIILSVLEYINVKIKKAILVSGYAKALRKDVNASKDSEEFNWEKIKEKAGEFIFINSDNDPWGCDDKQGKIMQEHLGGRLIIRHDGHMGSTTYNQPYKEFPLLLELI